jgi:hypothetical protein
MKVERIFFYGYMFVAGLVGYRYGEEAATRFLTLGIFIGVYAILGQVRGESRRIRKLVRASAVRVREDDTPASQ